jgi:hypothetical protein
VFKKTSAFGLLAAIAIGLASCAHPPSPHLIRISVPDQKMLVFEKGVEIARYDVSTSKFGVGDRPGSYETPLGQLEVKEKIGGGQPSGMKFKSRRPTGEIVPPNSPGRDPIVSRILWLRGLESQNRRALDRGIYIHGTAAEWSIGSPASYGCIRMRSHDVIQLFDRIGVGTRVEITNSHFPEAVLAGSGEMPPAEHYTMQSKPGSPTPTPIPASAHLNTPSPSAPHGSGNGPTPIPATQSHRSANLRAPVNSHIELSHEPRYSS